MQFHYICVRQIKGGRLLQTFAIFLPRALESTLFKTKPPIHTRSYIWNLLVVNFGLTPVSVHAFASFYYLNVSGWRKTARVFAGAAIPCRKSGVRRRRDENRQGAEDEDKAEPHASSLKGRLFPPAISLGFYRQAVNTDPYHPIFRLFVWLFAIRIFLSYH